MTRLASAASTAAAVPVRTRTPVPEPAMVARSVPPEPGAPPPSLASSVPPSVDSVTVIRSSGPGPAFAPTASGSETVMRSGPVKGSAVSSTSTAAAGATSTGRSFIGATSMISAASENAPEGSERR